MAFDAVKGIIGKQGDTSSTGAIRAYKPNQETQVAFNIEDFTKKGYLSPPASNIMGFGPASEA